MAISERRLRRLSSVIGPLRSGLLRRTVPPSRTSSMRSREYSEAATAREEVNTVRSAMSAIARATSSVVVPVSSTMRIPGSTMRAASRPIADFSKRCSSPPRAKVI